MDWKETLASLQAGLPEGEEPQKEETPTSPGLVTQKEPVRVSIDKKARKGKTATLIEGFLCDEYTVKEIARQLKAGLGTGGSVRGGDILLQGDWKAKASEMLKSMGYKTKG